MARERTGSDILARLRRRRIGRMAIAGGLATPDQVRAALRLQIHLSETGVERRIGEILVDQGFLSREKVEDLLALQARDHQPIPWNDLQTGAPGDPTDESLARVLLERGLVAREAIEECCCVRRVLTELGIERPLGAVLVARSAIDRATLEAVEREVAGTRSAGPIGAVASTGAIRPRRVEECQRVHRPRAPGLSSRRRLAGARAPLVVAVGSALAVVLGRFDSSERDAPESPPAWVAPPPTELPLLGSSAAREPGGPRMLSIRGQIVEVRRDLQSSAIREIVIRRRGSHVILRPSSLVDSRDLERLEEHAGLGDRIEAQGSSRRAAPGSPLTLPDRSLTEDYFEIVGWR